MIKVIIYLGFALILVLLISFLYTISYENDKGISNSLPPLNSEVDSLFINDDSIEEKLDTIT